MVSCQLTRAAFPTGLPMQMMADALWDKECDFEEKDSYVYSLSKPEKIEKEIDLITNKT